jgi:predicted TIM-barrel fold metal-dependent hydrolase
MKLALLAVAALLFQQGDRPPYKTSYRVVNAHHHWLNPDEDAVRIQIEVMDAAGIAVAVNLDGGRVDGDLPAWMELQKKHPGRFVTFVKFTLKDFVRVGEPGFFESLVREVERAAKMGARGVKVWKDLGMVIREGSGALLRVDDPRLDPFWARCGDLGLPVLLHTADPKDFWDPLTYNNPLYGARREEDQLRRFPGMPSWEELMAQRDNVVRKHPRTTFIGAHFASMEHDLQGLGERLDRFPNLHVESAARLRVLGRVNPRGVRDFFVKYQDRILFGSDHSILAGPRKVRRANIMVYPVDDPEWTRIDPKDADAVAGWKAGQLRFYGRNFEYYETDRLDLVDPFGRDTDWNRLSGARLPPEVLEKFYRANAERLIPGIAPNK